MKAASSLLVTCVLALLSIGMVALYSATMPEENAHFFMMQLVWSIAGLTACFGLAWMNPDRLGKWGIPIFLTAVVLVGLVLIPGIGYKINGARRWFDFGPVRFQPSEFAKLALVIGLATYADRNQRHMDRLGRGLIIPVAAVGCLLALIFQEPDRGTTVLLAAVAGSLLLIAGVRWVYLAPPALLGAGGLGYLLWTDEIRRRRIEAWWDLEKAKDGAGFQVYQAVNAVGSGGMQGVGLGDGRHKLGLVPEHETDFIFSVIGEELGLVATLGILIAFVVLLASGFVIASRSGSLFKLLLGAGVTFLIGFQALINIGVVTGVFPNKGLPLPFISYGGSNLLTMMACVGILLSLARHASEAPEEGERNPFRKGRRLSHIS